MLTLREPCLYSMFGGLGEWMRSPEASSNVIVSKRILVTCTMQPTHVKEHVLTTSLIIRMETFAGHFAPLYHDPGVHDFSCNI